jgi:N-acetylmuramoyl-L-alanine amidase
MARVVIDAGHGGYDPGAVFGSRLEKDDNLRMALVVGNILRGCGIDVVYTRSTDVFVPLLERSAISNRANPNLFVSIHRNASTNPAANGVENWVATNASAFSVAAANLVLNRVVAAGVQSNRGLKYGTFSVLRNTNAPAMLFEYGFISNAEDNRLFDTRFNDYARATASGIISSLGRNCPGVTTPTPPTTQPPPPPGDYVENVRRIQTFLNTNYNAGLTVDGNFGPVSKRALIRAYQIELNRMFNAGLATDGIWGPRTRAATRTLRIGDRNNLVWLMQAALYTNGFSTIPDGSFGPITDGQVRAFQRARGLGIDGLAGPNTFERLFRWE